MFGYMVLLFTLLPALELIVLIEVGSYIGSINTILIIVLTGVVGAYLARLQGFFLFRKIQDNLNQGIMPTEEMMDGLMILVGGIVLLTPGFITDFMGFLLLVPITRQIIKQIIRARFNAMINAGQITTFHSSDPRRRPHNNDDIEDAEFF